jgi:hypothetical protein
MATTVSVSAEHLQINSNTDASTETNATPGSERRNFEFCSRERCANIPIYLLAIVAAVYLLWPEIIEYCPGNPSGGLSLSSRIQLALPKPSHSRAASLIESPASPPVKAKAAALADARLSTTRPEEEPAGIITAAPSTDPAGPVGPQASREIEKDVLKATPLNHLNPMAPLTGAQEIEAAKFELPSQWLNRSVHILFMGDSVTRYQFLDLAWAVHSKGKPLSRKHSFEGAGWKNWEEFYRGTTDLFDGSMNCDCYRHPTFHCGDVRFCVENRYYRHPDYPLRLTHLQLFGDTPMTARIPLRLFGQGAEITPSTSTTFSGNLSFAESLTETIRKHISTMNPLPDAVVMNVGFWQHPALAQRARDIIDAVEMLGCWSAYGPNWTPASGSERPPRKSRCDRPSPILIWKETSLPYHPPELRDQILPWRKGHWNTLLDRNIRATGRCPNLINRHPSDNEFAQQHTPAGSSDKQVPIASAKSTCYYFPFPGPLPRPRSGYWDALHLQAHVSREWNSALWSHLTCLLH